MDLWYCHAWEGRVVVFDVTWLCCVCSEGVRGASKSSGGGKVVRTAGRANKLHRETSQDTTATGTYMCVCVCHVHNMLKHDLDP